MGLYDKINYEMKCPDCGTLVNDFQSKDADCMLLLIDPQHVNNMYAICSKCNKWIELSRSCPLNSAKPRDIPYTYDEVIEMGFDIVEKR